MDIWGYYLLNVYFLRGWHLYDWMVYLNNCPCIIFIYNYAQNAHIKCKESIMSKQNYLFKIYIFFVYSIFVPQKGVSRLKATTILFFHMNTSENRRTIYQILFIILLIQGKVSSPALSKDLKWVLQRFTRIICC